MNSNAEFLIALAICAVVGFTIGALIRRYGLKKGKKGKRRRY